MQFHELPAEIRNEIYNICFQPETFQIRWINSRVNSSLTYLAYSSEGPFDEGSIHQPILDKSTHARREQAKQRMRHHQRIKSKELPRFPLQPGPTALLIASKRINIEATPIFYSRNTFHFASSSTLKRFLRSVGDAALHNIRRLELLHSGRKDNYRDQWVLGCQMASEKLPSLSPLAIVLRSPEGGRCGVKYIEQLLDTVFAFAGRRYEKIHIRFDPTALGHKIQGLEPTEPDKFLYRNADLVQHAKDMKLRMSQPELATWLSQELKIRETDFDPDSRPRKMLFEMLAERFEQGYLLRDPQSDVTSDQGT